MAIYFPNIILQKLANCYYRTLFKFFKFDFSGKNFNDINNFLSSYNLFAFQHRLFFRTFLFVFKIFSNPKSPENLKEALKLNETRNLAYKLRNSDNLAVNGACSKFSQHTFGFMMSRFINNCCFQAFSLNLNDFKINLVNNINIYFDKICKLFSKFNLFYKNFFVK